jgi:hypothetical protein
MMAEVVEVEVSGGGGEARSYVIKTARVLGKRGGKNTPIRRLRRTMGTKTMENRNKKRDTTWLPPHFVNCNMIR